MESVTPGTVLYTAQGDGVGDSGDAIGMLQHLTCVEHVDGGEKVLVELHCADDSLDVDGGCQVHAGHGGQWSLHILGFLNF